MCKQRHTCRLLSHALRLQRHVDGRRGGVWEWREEGYEGTHVGELEGGDFRGVGSGGLQGFCTVRRTLDSDKRSIQPSFNPLVQSRRDKRNPQKQIRLLRPETTAETKSQAVVFVCRAGVLQPYRNDKGGGIHIYIADTRFKSSPFSD